MATFDEFASQYDKWYSKDKGSFIDKVETDLVFKMLNIKKSMRILDVGCGTGNFSFKLAELGCQVTGIDVSEEMLAIAKAKASEHINNIDFLKMDVTDLNFADNTFDIAISMAAFEFIADTGQALDEMFRVVKTGGQILVGTIAGDSQWGEFYKSKPLRENTVFKYAHFKTLREMKGWKQHNLVNTGECLYISPLSDDAEFTLEHENKLAGKKKGGYICVLWGK